MASIVSAVNDKYKVSLTEEEARLFNVLLESVKWKRSNDGGRIDGEETILRVAGGWVRDKILQRESHDIDIALNNLSGVQFANYVNEYLVHMGQQTRTIAVIQANPDQSKHLETANLRVLGLEIDCVNLRAETYTEESRIPQISFGTPLQDALRRDFTINSLFYNLNAQSVEDFTGQGISDLESGIIRTPLSAHITFKDDPLRVLRAIRFSSRLNFRLDEELIEAASSSEIISALHSKVSRERVYKELDGMMITTQSRPYVAFSLMFRLNILDSVFLVDSLWNNSTAAPTSPVVSSTWQQTSMTTLSWLNTLLTLRQTIIPDSVGLAFNSNIVVPQEVSVERQSIPKYGGFMKVLHLAAALVGVKDIKVVEKKKEFSFVSVILRDSLKIDTNTLREVQTLVDCMRGFIELSCSDIVSVDIAGSLLRTCTELWRECIVLACAFSIAQLEGSENIISHIVPGSRGPVIVPVHLRSDAMNMLVKFSQLQATIEGLHLDNVWLLKPLLDGSQLIERLGLKKGPAIGIVMEEQIKWQIRTKSDSVEDCVKYLLDHNIRNSHS